MHFQRRAAGLLLAASLTACASSPAPDLTPAGTQDPTSTQEPTYEAAADGTTATFEGSTVTVTNADGTIAGSVEVPHGPVVLTHVIPHVGAAPTILAVRHTPESETDGNFAVVYTIAEDGGIWSLSDPSPLKAFPQTATFTIEVNDHADHLFVVINVDGETHRHGFFVDGTTILADEEVTFTEK